MFDTARSLWLELPDAVVKSNTNVQYCGTSTSKGFQITFESFNGRHVLQTYTSHPTINQTVTNSTTNRWAWMLLLALTAASIVRLFFDQPGQTTPYAVANIVAVWSALCGALFFIHDAISLKQSHEVREYHCLEHKLIYLLDRNYPLNMAQLEAAPYLWVECSTVEKVLVTIHLLCTFVCIVSITDMIPLLGHWLVTIASGLVLISCFLLRYSITPIRHALHWLGLSGCMRTLMRVQIRAAYLYQKKLGHLPPSRDKKQLALCQLAHHILSHQNVDEKVSIITR